MARRRSARATPSRTRVSGIFASRATLAFPQTTTSWSARPAADDLYGRDLLRCCVEALDEHPGVVLAHSYTAAIDADGTVTHALDYPLATASPHAPERLRSFLFGSS